MTSLQCEDECVGQVKAGGFDVTLGFAFVSSLCVQQDQLVMILVFMCPKQLVVQI